MQHNTRLKATGFILSALFFVGAGCASGGGAGANYTNDVTDTNLGVTISCVEGWTCQNNNDGGLHIFNPDAYVGFTITDTTNGSDPLTDAFDAEVNKRLMGGEVADQGELGDGMYAYITGGSIADEQFLYMETINGTNRVCHANITDGSYEEYAADIKAICQSMKASS